MKKALLLGLTVGLVVVCNSGPAAAINCTQVNKMLKMGRTPDDIATTMVVDIAEVEKCKEEGEKAAPTPGAPQK